MTKVNKIEKRVSTAFGLFRDVLFSAFSFVGKKKAKQLLDSAKLSTKLIKPKKVLTSSNCVCTLGYMKTL